VACDSVTVTSHWPLSPVPRVETKRKKEKRKKENKIKRELKKLGSKLCKSDIGGQSFLTV